MPNWCKNHIEISGPKAKVLELLNLTLAGGLLKSVIPWPEELAEIINRSGGKFINGRLTNCPNYYKEIDGKQIPVTDEDKNQLIKKYGTWELYTWKKQNWGTGWTDDITSDINEVIAEITKNISTLNVTAKLDFVTGWTPPLKVYEKLLSEGFVVNANYYERDNAYYGWFKDGQDHCFNITGFKSIDPAIVKIFSIEPELVEDRAAN